MARFPVMLAAAVLGSCNPATTGGGGGGGEDGPCAGRAGQTWCPTVAMAQTCAEDGSVDTESTCGDDEICVDAAGCIGCGVTLSIPWSADGESARVSLDAADVAAGDFAWRRFAMRPVSVEMDPSLTSGEIAVDGVGVALWTEDGEALDLPWTVQADGVAHTLLIQGLEPGAAGLSATWTHDERVACQNPANVALTVVEPFALAGRSLAVYPWFERVDAFSEVEQPQVAIDPSRHADRIGQPYDVYVVAHRTAAEWGADPALVDVADGAESATVSAGSTADNIVTAWATDPVASRDHVGDGYDVVLDFGRDGTLDPGDLFEGPGADAPAFWVLPDLSGSGALDVTTADYSGGTWLGQRAWYPTGIADLVAERGARPLVVISHGNGHDYTWYDYLGEHLASWGYVVMAHQNDTGPGVKNAATTTLTNTAYFLDNVDIIASGALSGMVDPHRIAWIGHSRGGEGVVIAYSRLVGGGGSGTIGAEDIVFLSSIAPTVFYGLPDTDPHDSDYHLIAGAADGDVTGGPGNPVVQYQRISEAATGDVAVTYVHGASHNDFNCCGTADGTGPDLIGRPAVQTVAKGVYLALLEQYVEGNPATADAVRRAFPRFLADDLGSDAVVASRWRPGDRRERLVLDDFQDGNSDSGSSSAGTTVSTDVAELAEAVLDDADGSFEWRRSDPLNGMTLAESVTDSSRGTVFEWGDGDDVVWEVALPEDGRDLRGWTWLSLRACQGTRHPNTVALDDALSFEVTLVDGGGAEATLSTDPASEITSPYPRRNEGAGQGWANEWNGVRLRLTDFEADGSGIDLADVASVRLSFGVAHGSAQGRLGLDDVMLSVE